MRLILSAFFFVLNEHIQVILITGGTGLLGAHLVRRLKAEGEQVRILYRSEASKENLKRILGYYNSSVQLQEHDFFKGDVHDLFSLDAALEGVTKVIHAAAVVSFAPGKESFMYKTNIEGTANMVNSCLAAGRDIRFIHISSVAALSKPSVGMTDEVSGGRQEPSSSSYATSKFASEQEVWRGFEEGLTGFIVNPSVILGPGNWRTDSSQIFGTVRKGLKFYPAGTTGFVGVHDVVEAIIFLDKRGITGESYVLNAEDLRYADFLTMMSRALGVKSPQFRLSKGVAIAGMYVEAVMKLFNRKERKLSSDLINAMMETNSFSSDKIRSLGFSFAPVKEVIKETAEAYLRSEG